MKIIILFDNDNINKTIIIESKNIDKYESINDKNKRFKIIQSNDKIIFKDISNQCKKVEKEKGIAQKVKITLKKDADDKEKIIYEVSNLCEN